MFSMHSFAILFVLELTVGSSLADICFEGTPQATFREPLFSIQAQESDGQLCATVVRDEADVDDEDFETFQYSTFPLGSPVFGDDTAGDEADYTAVSSVMVSFPESSTNVTICVDLIFDDFACEREEDFGIQLISTNPAFNTVCNTPRAIATIEDSTVINLGFTSSTAEVSENAGSVPLSVTRFSRTQNIHPAQVMVMEDPDTPGCLASSPIIIYPCVAARCSDGATFDLTKDIESQANPRLVDDDDVIDGHKECQILLRPVDSTCLFNFTRERMQLIVRDNERFFIALSSDFYQEEEDEGGVDVTVLVQGFGNIPITVAEPVDFTLSISTDGVDDPVEVGVDLPNKTYVGSIPPGQSNTSVRILFTPDDVYESIERFKLILMPSDNRYNLIPSVRSADVLIVNDDSLTVQFPLNLTVQESDGELTFALLTEQEYEGEICVFVRARAASTAQLSGDLQLATANEDFVPIRSEVCFRNNSRTSDNFTVPILGASDNIPEFNEVFSVAVELGVEADPVFLNLPDRPATVLNIDTSDPYVLQFSQSEYRVVEDTGGTDVTVTVDRPPAFDIPFTVVASVSGSGPEYATLTNGFRSDILGTEWNGTIVSGQENATFSIDILVDNLVEFDEQFNITLTVLSNPRLAVANQDENVALVVIEDDDEVMIKVDTAERSREGVNMVHNITFTAVGSFAVPFSINVMFINGTAEDGSDYDGTLQKVTFTPSDTVQIVSVPILNDGEEEGDENFRFFSEVDSSVRLSVNTIQAMGVVIISDNEVAHFFEMTMYVVGEDAQSLSVALRRRGYLDRQSSVSIVPKNGTRETSAQGPGDFPLAPVLATFGSGVEVMNFSVPITPDMISEHNETFSLQLAEIPSIVTDPDSGTTLQLVEDLVVEPDNASVIITDVNDIVCVSFSESAYSSSEGDGDKLFTVVADKMFTYDFRVIVTAMEVTATFGTDYSNMSFELTFTPGVDRISESLSIIDDLVKEMNESVNLVLSVPDDNPRPVCIKSPGTATCTVVDNDDISVQFEQPQYTVSEGNTITVNVVASTDFSTPFSVDISHDGSGDLTLSSDVLSFSPSSRTASVMLTATEDAIKELDESFTLSLAVTDPMSQDFGVELGERSTATVIVQDTTEDIVCGFFPTMYTVAEGGTVPVMLNCSLPASEDYSLTVSQSGGESDFTLASDTVTISANSITSSVNVMATTDDIKECDESFQISVSPTSSSASFGVTLRDDTATINIQDGTADVSITFDPSTYTVSEGNTVQVFMMADKDYSEPFNVTVNSVNTEDISILPMSVTFEPPNRRVSVNVLAQSDDIQEQDEDVTLNFTIGDSCLESVVAGDPSEATVTITDATGSVVVCFDETSYSVTEGGEVTVGIFANRTFTSSFTVTAVHPDPDGDYEVQGRPVTFTPGDRAESVRFVTLADTVKELNETVSLMLQVVDDGGIDVELCPQSTTVVTIFDDNEVTVSFSPTTYTVMEGGSVIVTLQADIAAQVEYTIDVVLTSGGGDIMIVNSTAVFRAGSVEATVLVSGTVDSIKECEESFQISASLTSSSTNLGVTIGNGIADVTVQDKTEDVSITFDPSTYTVSEGNIVEVFLMADKDYSEPFNVTVNSVNNTEDISILPMSVTFEPPNRRVSVTVMAQSDDIQEQDENVTLNVTIGDSCLESVVAGDPSEATVTITDTTESVQVNFGPPPAPVREGDTITISVVADRDFTAPFTVGILAADSDDFDLLDTTVRFTPGTQEGSFRFRANRDAVKEKNETVTLTLNIADSGGIDVVVGPMGTTSVTIIDDNKLTVALTDMEYTVTEGNAATILISATSAASELYTVNIATSPGTAQEADYTPGPYVATFNPGETIASVSINTLGTDCAEPLETFRVDVQPTTTSAELGVVIGSPSQANVVITDRKVLKVSFEDISYSSVEGSSIIATLVTDKCFEGEFEVKLVPSLTGSAENSDFMVPPSMNVTEQNKTEVTIVTIDDMIPEGEEEFNLVLQVSPTSDGISVVVGDRNNASFTIIDNDAVACQFGDSQYSVDEGSVVNITVECNASTPAPYTVTIVSTHVSTEDADFQQGPYTATFTAGDTSAGVQIRTIPDSCAEPLEMFTLSLMLPNNLPQFSLIIGDRSESTVTITDNTVVPVHFDMNSYETDEGETFNPAIIVDQCYSGTFSINVATADGTATAGADYNAVSTSVSFSGGQRSDAISIPTFDDDDTEPKTFTASLSAGSIPPGLNVEIDPPSATFTILTIDEPAVNVSFSQRQYRVKEGDMLVVQFVVLGSSVTPAEVRVTSVNGTAFSGLDYDAVDVRVNPRTETVTVHVLLDEIREDVESFQLMLTIPPTAADVFPGAITTATVFISDLDVRTVNDTIIADPVYAIPLKIVNGNIPGSNGDVSLCYEIHGSPDTWFNLISDTCLSVNAHYLEAELADNRIGHIVDRLGALIVSRTSQCRQAMVSMVEGVCSFTVDGSSVEMFDEDGVMVTKRRNRVRISAPNCDNQMVIIWAVCEKFSGVDMMKIVVNRGFNLNPTSHGFIGQFWNIDVSLERYNDNIVKEALNRDSVNPHYIIHLDPPAPAEKRSLVGELYHQQWDMSRKSCLYVGSNQGGAGVDNLKPVGTVVEGTYTDYITSGPFEHTSKFNRFDTSTCESET